MESNQPIADGIIRHFSCCSYQREKSVHFQPYDIQITLAKCRSYLNLTDRYVKKAAEFLQPFFVSKGA
ncbi:hypothetical protein ACE3MQ_11655 [Paenibacillus lentus]